MRSSIAKWGLGLVVLGVLFWPTLAPAKPGAAQRMRTAWAERVCDAGFRDAIKGSARPKNAAEALLKRRLTLLGKLEHVTHEGCCASSTLFGAKPSGTSYALELNRLVEGGPVRVVTHTFRRDGRVWQRVEEVPAEPQPLEGEAR